MLHCIVSLINGCVLNKKERKKRKEKEVCFCNACCIVLFI